MLRMCTTDHPGPSGQDPDWSLQRLAADTVAALTLTSSETRGLADHWRRLTLEQIRERDRESPPG